MAATPPSVSSASATPAKWKVGEIAAAAPFLGPVTISSDESQLVVPLGSSDPIPIPPGAVEMAQTICGAEPNIYNPGCWIYLGLLLIEIFNEVWDLIEDLINL